MHYYSDAVFESIRSNIEAVSETEYESERSPRIRGGIWWCIWDDVFIF